MTVSVFRDPPVVWPSGLSALGAIMIVIGATIVSPLVALPFYPGESANAGAYLNPGISALFLGMTMILFGKHSRKTMRVMPIGERDATLVVVAGWVIAVMVGAAPIAASTDLDFARSVFESVSGWTTTGLSVVDVEKAPRLLLLYRSSIQLVGGAGLAIAMLSVFRSSSGMGIARAEGRTYQLAPQVAHSASLVVRLYAGYAIGGSILLALSGMSVYDAINHSFAAVSTGGFSTRYLSIGYWDSPLIEAATIVLMILGNLNFMTAYVLVRGKFRTFWKNGEVRLLAFAIGIASVLIFGLVVRGMYGSLSKEIRVAVFETVTAVTTTGFSTVGYTDWKPVGVHILIILMSIGGGVCSTAGGIKQLRVVILLKSALREVRRLCLPRSTVLVDRIFIGEDETFVGDRKIAEAGAFAFVYVAALSLGAAILVVGGYEFLPSLFEFASALGTVGISVGVTSVSAPDSAIWAMSVGMFLGRLEFFAVFASIAYAGNRIAKAARSKTPRRTYSTGSAS